MTKLEEKKQEILSGLFRTKEGLTCNETTELLNELIEICQNTTENLAFFDFINNSFEEEQDLKSIKEYVNENFIDGGEMHPNFYGFEIYKKIGSLSISETDEVRNGEPVYKLVYSV